MTTRNNILKPFISLSSLLASKVRFDRTLIEQCSLLSSTRDYQSLGLIAEMIDDPVSTLFKAIAANDYTNPEEFVVDNISDIHRARMIKCVATGLTKRGDLRMAQELCNEASRLAVRHHDFIALFQVQQQLAIIHSTDGNSKTALEILKSIQPLSTYLYQRRPAFYYNYLNSFAVELAEVGQLNAAEHFIGIALASPYVFAYPEWLETRDELLARITRPSKSVVSTGRIKRKTPDNVLALPVAPPVDRLAEVPEITSAPKAKIFTLREWVRPHMDDKQTKKKPVEDQSSPDDIEHEFVKRWKKSNPTVDQYKRMIDILAEEDSNAEEGGR